MGWVCPPQRFLLVPVCWQVLGQPHLKDTVTWPGTPGRWDSRFISRAICQDLGLCSAQFSVTHEAVDQTPPSPDHLWVPSTSQPHFCFSYPLRPKVTKTLSPGWDCASHHDQVLQSSWWNHFALTATPDYSILEDQCVTLGTGRSSQGGNCALQIFAISESDFK